MEKSKQASKPASKKEALASKKEALERAIQTNAPEDITALLDELDRHLERINQRLSQEVGAPVALRNFQALTCTGGKNKFCMNINGKQVCWCV